MTSEQAVEKREQMLRDGYCVIDNVVPEDFLVELRNETERLIENHVELPEHVYQGQHIGVKRDDNSVIEKLLSWAPSYAALKELGFGDFETNAGSVIILTKEPKGPPLYWHQDWMKWDDPMSASPWPQTIFLNYYLTDTTVDNGCLMLIPGSHRKRMPLHDKLVPAHEQGARFIEEDDPVMFSDVPGQIDVPVKAGSLVLADARILHAARRNKTDQRRTLVLAWHSRPVNTIPDYWDGDVPDVIANRDPNAEYDASRIPGKYLKN